MHGHIERLCPHVGILRVGGAFGEPWVRACVLRYEDETTVMVEAVERAPSPSEWRAAMRVMRDAGIRTIRFERHRGGRVIVRHLTTRVVSSDPT